MQKSGSNAPAARDTHLSTSARAINPFIVSAVKIVRANTGLSIAKDTVTVQQGKFTPAGMGLTLDVHGQLEGKIVYEFSKGVAVRLSRAMIEKQLDPGMLDAANFRQLLHSALLELGNQIAAHAVTLLAENGIHCGISAPVFYLGQGIELIHPELRTIVLTLKTEFGPFSISIAFQSARV
ncbi:MAG: chemotaxis protein CheX [Spirochaetota bacterium]|nr:chemotaxis protein CheX [Spirochaetota bacterium]